MGIKLAIMDFVDSNAKEYLFKISIILKQARPINKKSPQLLSCIIYCLFAAES